MAVEKDGQPICVMPAFSMNEYGVYAEGTTFHDRAPRDCFVARDLAAPGIQIRKINDVPQLFQRSHNFRNFFRS
ncbi:MAG TPA: hypothetical protein VJN42_07875, partial [Candidatus Acidoferrum sp.]|nr:hypothetical protein [Candidatus Acidoferrum sp.]